MAQGDPVCGNDLIPSPVSSTTSRYPRERNFEDVACPASAHKLALEDAGQFAIGRTANERMLWEDLKQVLRELAIAEVRDEINAWGMELEQIEGVIPDVDGLIEDVLGDDADAAA